MNCDAGLWMPIISDMKKSKNYKMLMQ